MTTKETLRIGLCLALGLTAPSLRSGGEVSFPTSLARSGSSGIHISADRDTTLVRADLALTGFSNARKVESVRTTFDFAAGMESDTTGAVADLYVKWRLETLSSNFLLPFIPSLGAIKDGDEEFNERYSNVRLVGTSLEETIVAEEGTLPHHKGVFPTMVQFFVPDAYSKTLFRGNVLSPFNRSNRKYYKYSSLPLSDSSSVLSFKPRVANTQLVSGSAVVHNATGRLVRAEVRGDYDMMDYNVRMEMGGGRYPLRSDIDVDFKLLGNKVSSEITSSLLPSTGLCGERVLQMDSLRPFPLTDEEKGLCGRSANAGEEDRRDSCGRKNPGSLAWKEVGNRLFNSFKTNLGTKDEFSFKASPLLNPSYLSYSHRKGISYRMDLNGRYVISDNSDLNFKTRFGYMFNKRQFYFDLPFTLTYNERRHGSVGLTVGNGNRIRNSSVKEQLILMEQFFPMLKEPEFDHYTDMYAKANTTFDITDRLSANFCIAFHQRSPVKKEIYKTIGQPTAYRTFSPMLELKYRPLKDRGPIFTLDYERGVEGVLGSGIEYDIFESDAEWLVPLAPLSSLSMRLGGGFYASKSDGIYFLDFSNFRDNNLPGGWNDDWSGEFQLLDPVLYNVSNYYLRSNLTFEHPMLLASYIPWGGKFIETERIYINAMVVERIRPYTEFGYGFTNRFFSTGIYASFKNWKFERIGFRFTLEIFSKWN